MRLAVAVTLAMPDALVTAVGLDSVAPAPLAGGVKVTVAPLTGLPNVSLTVACRAIANAEPLDALCGVPAVAVMEAAAPVVLVSEKLAGVAAPDAVAVTA